MKLSKIYMKRKKGNYKMFTFEYTNEDDLINYIKAVLEAKINERALVLL